MGVPCVNGTNGLPCPNGTNGQPCLNSIDNSITGAHNTESKIEMELEGSMFHKVLTVDDLFQIFQKNPEASYVLNGGNTAHGNCSYSCHLFLTELYSNRTTL